MSRAATPSGTTSPSYYRCPPPPAPASAPKPVPVSIPDSAARLHASLQLGRHTKLKRAQAFSITKVDESCSASIRYGS